MYTPKIAKYVYTKTLESFFQKMMSFFHFMLATSKDSWPRDKVVHHQVPKASALKANRSTRMEFLTLKWVDTRSCLMIKLTQ